MMHKDVLDARPEVRSGAHLLVDARAGAAALQKKGAVLGVSGGIDSSVVAALCVRAFGKDKVSGCSCPSAHSSAESLTLGRMLADSLGLEAIVEDIAPALEGLGCYRAQDEAIRSVVPRVRRGLEVQARAAVDPRSDRLNVTADGAEPDGRA